MVVVCGYGGHLCVCHGDLWVERGEFKMLLVLFWAVMPARKRKDQRIIALQLAKLPQCARVVGQFVVGKSFSGNNIRTHLWTPVIAEQGIAYSGGSVPSCSALINLAYQSGQSLSACPILFSC